MTPEQERLVLDNLDLVRSVVGRLIKGGMWFPSPEDARGDGYVGLVKAALAFDPTQQTATFRTFAAYRIRGAVIDGARAFSRANGYHRDLGQIVKVELFPKGFNPSYVMALPDDRWDAVARRASVLTPRERTVLNLLPSAESGADIGRQIGITQTRVSQHMFHIIDKMREELNQMNNRRRRHAKKVRKAGGVRKPRSRR